jgi:hypothetical protein
MKAIDASPVFVVSSNCLQHPPGEYLALMTNTRYQARLMGVMPVRMVPGNPLGAVLTLLQPRLHRLTAQLAVDVPLAL